MKATIFAVFTLFVASVCAQAIVVPREYYYSGVPRAVTDLEARGWHINWHKVGNFAKGAAKIGASILFRRMDEDELYARGFIDNEDLVTRDFDDDNLEARGWHINWHQVGNVAKDAAKIGASILFKRMDEDELNARGFIDQEDLVTRDFHDDYLEARGWHINWHKVGNVAKDAAKIGADILFKRMDEDELSARGFIEKEDLVRDLEREQDDWNQPGARRLHRLSRQGANHKKVGKFRKTWAAKGAVDRDATAGSLDDLN